MEIQHPNRGHPTVSASRNITASKNLKLNKVMPGSSQTPNDIVKGEEVTLNNNKNFTAMLNYCINK